LYFKVVTFKAKSIPKGDMQIIFETEDKLLINSVKAFVEIWNGSDNWIEVKTSGSTGTPKTISIEKKFMRASAQMTGEYLNLNKNDTALLCLSPETIAGKMMIVRAIELGLTLIVVDVNSNPLARVQVPIHFAAMVPFQAYHSLLNNIEKFDFIKKLIVGGGSVSQELERKLSSLPTEAYQTMTETISHVAMRRINGTTSTYSALPGVEFGINDNCLTIYAEHLGLENLQTNDIVRLTESHSFEWIGRADFVINSGGIKIHPEIIEASIESLFTMPYFSTGLPDSILGSKHVVCIESNENCKVDKQTFEKLLDKQQIPKEIYLFESFNYTPSGKINRVETLNNISNATKQIL
jgi:o-succinylbenzoate---CoA ligase